MSKKKLNRLKAMPVTEHANLGDLLREVLKVAPPKGAPKKKAGPRKSKKR